LFRILKFKILYKRYIKEICPNKKMKVLVTGKQRGSTNALAPVVSELLARKHEAIVVATGNHYEVRGFRDHGYDYPIKIIGDIISEDFDYEAFLRSEKPDVVLTGMSGYITPDGHFLRAANRLRIPTVSLLGDTNNNYAGRLGEEPTHLPDIIAVMDDTCKVTMEEQLPDDISQLALPRTHIVGWVAFDRYKALREEFTDEDREKLLVKYGMDPTERWHLHLTNNFHYDSKFVKDQKLSLEQKKVNFKYHSEVTQAVFEALYDLELNVAVKPHPGEDNRPPHKTKSSAGTFEMVALYDFKYIDPSASTVNYMLAVDSISAGTSTCLTEATLLDKSTVGIIPDKGDWVQSSPPLRLDAIPYTTDWREIKANLNLVSSKYPKVQAELAENRKKFSVDGNASKRLVDLIERL
jgi:hypothetical protein